MTGLEDAGVDAATHVLDERAEQPRGHRSEGERSVEHETCLRHLLDQLRSTLIVVAAPPRRTSTGRSTYLLTHLHLSPNVPQTDCRAVFSDRERQQATFMES